MVNNIHWLILLLWYYIYWYDWPIPYRPYHIYHGQLVFIPWLICYICYIVSSANVPVLVCVIYDIDLYMLLCVGWNTICKISYASAYTLNTEHIIVGTPRLTGFLWNILSLGQCTAHDITEICYQWADTQMTVTIYLGQHTTDYIQHMY